MNTRGVLASMLITLTACSPALAAGPPLPPGLAPPAQESARETPPLPPGLDAPKPQDGPPLPPGLDAPKPQDGPPLPPGLDAPKPQDGPPLPPGLDDPPPAAPAHTEPAPDLPLRERLPFPVHGFWEMRGGLRFRDDPAQKRQATLGETRLQLKTHRAWDRAVLDLTGDLWADAVLEEINGEFRQIRLSWTVTDSVDLRAGRQVLTWGTGDMLFINDLFPKDWVSFFIGRDDEYLKAPSDSLRIGWFTNPVNIEFVYTPRFTPDRFITGERVSYWDPLFRRYNGGARPVNAAPPRERFTANEFHWRLYRNIGTYEAAVYGYDGHWKSPGGQRLAPFMQATFPRLAVHGASLRGPLGKGIFNVEAGYYLSRDDRRGRNPFVNNSEIRLLLGYEREIARDFTAGVQYYLEHMMQYREYRRTLPFLLAPRDQNRHVITLRLTRLMMNQNLTLSLFTYYSPSDADLYLRPRIAYKLTDAWQLEAGGNIFAGRRGDTFFGQFKRASNAYVGARYAF